MKSWKRPNFCDVDILEYLWKALGWSFRDHLPKNFVLIQQSSTHFLEGRVDSVVGYTFTSTPTKHHSFSSHIWYIAYSALYVHPERLRREK